MSNHKRGRPKNRRAGCLLCKPHKANGVNEEEHKVRKKEPECEQCLDTGVDLFHSGLHPCPNCNPGEERC